MIFFTSDTHFNHVKILEFEPKSRPFETLEEMNETIINNWNSRVTDEDTVYILGDMFMGPLEPIDEIMPRLKGKKILIRGNHDTNSRVSRMAPYLEGIYDMYNLKIDGQIYVLCHYPMREWFSKDYGAIHLYGHVHSNGHRSGEHQDENTFHVGVDVHNLTPVSLEEIKNRKYCKYVVKGQGRMGLEEVVTYVLE